ncbi:MAG TPA: site-2 protease family protein [Chloroflexota bacterium]|nr:site-2 protease family protein [Chloroflexota bacterium]
MEAFVGQDRQPEARGSEASLVEAASGIMDVYSTEWVVHEEGARRRRVGPEPRLFQIRGRLMMDSEKAYDLLAPRFEAMGFTLAFRRGGGDHLALAIPGLVSRETSNTRTATLLFVATLLSVLWIGALNNTQPGQPFSLWTGLPFALSLMGILLAHEMGHYLVSRWLREPASLPYFIPFPLPITLIGTLGAVIVSRSPSRSRRTLLLMGVAGPLVGLLVAVPVLVWGLTMSEVAMIPPGAGYFQEGNSILYAWLKFFVFGQFLPYNGMDVFIHPVAFAGWVGLLVTGLNLIPAGQLDGGHMAYVLFGSRARYIAWAVVAVLLVLSTQSLSWLLWAAIIVAIGRDHPTPLDDITGLTTTEKALAAFALLVVFPLVFTPIPIAFN